MVNIPLEINNTGKAREKNPVSIGIPIPKSKIMNVNMLAVEDGETIIPSQFTTLAKWPDGSIKWVLLDFQPSVKSNCLHTYLIKESPQPQKETQHTIVIKEQDNSLEIDTGSTTFSINTDNSFPFSSITNNNLDILSAESSRLVLINADKSVFTPKVNKLTTERQGNLKTTIKAEGSFSKNGRNLLSFIARLHFFKNKSFVKIDFTIWNKNPAKHAGGLWDLGDPGSVLFKELSLQFSIAKGLSIKNTYRAEQGQDFKEANSQDITIYQDSSGGGNWQSTNHINRDQQIPIRFKGYKIHHEDIIVSEGARATPIVYVGNEEYGVSATINKFWQNFPKAISTRQNKIKLDLYPGQFADLHELQGGERKTHSMFIDFGGSPEALISVDQPLHCTIPREWYAKTETIPYLSSTTANSDKLYDSLLKSLITGPNSFLNKREIIDEYGWRNFGEVYADHEAIGHEGKTPLISHYNNQYDQVYGFFREYIASGDTSWFELMDDLAHHVSDIDIYHTNGDRHEYNNGLHWHTNHYLDAATCTHRSMSKEHLKKHDPQFYGGGPGMEHCYGSGFMYHYYATGEESSKDTLLTLADWINSCTSSPETLLGMVNKIKSLLPQWKQALSGNKRIRADRYPLTRGAGNPLSALLDAHMLSSDKQYLIRAEKLIKGCIHPHDDIESRNLLDAEEAWSYNVCLQAIGKYLDVKININELDYMYSYAQEALLHYAKWMLKHEYPYLAKSDILEFPNETWSAQDLRKSCIFYFAAKHSERELKTSFLEKAEYFHHYVINKLNEFETKTLARPIVLLMQNRWMHAYSCAHPEDNAPRCSDHYDFSRKDEFWTKRVIMKNIVSFFINALKKTSLDRERHWLRCRQGKHI